MEIYEMLKQTVQMFMDQNCLFTGYDVTIETRKRENIFLKHSEVNDTIRNLVLNMIDDEDYEKTRMDMPGGGWAWVYHPYFEDPQSYTPHQVKESMNQPKVNNGCYTRDYRNRLMIPKHFVENAGLQAGDTCYVYFDKEDKKLLIDREENDLAGVLVGCYRIEKYGDVRICSGVLNNLDGDKYLIENSNSGLVTIKPAL